MIKRILLFLLLGILFMACQKKKAAMTGVYTGTERHVYIYGGGEDTMTDETYQISMSIELSGDFFIFKKSTYPHSFSVQANKVVRSQGFSLSEWGNPVEKWKGNFSGNRLKATFEENNWFAGRHDFYYFDGSK